MNNIAGKIFIFAVGTAVGVLASSRYFNKKYEEKAKEEIEEVREYYKGAHRDIEKEKTEDATVTINVSEMRRLADVVSDDSLATHELQEYDKIASTYKKKKEEGGEKGVNEPYIISPEEFDSIGYKTSSLTYYADGILTDEKDKVIDDPGYYVSDDFMDHFGEYEDDSVFVRNDDLETDFEILLDERNFYEVETL